MALKTKAVLNKTLAESARRARQVREAAEKLKGAAGTAEGETASTPISLTRPTFSPVVK